MNREPLIDWKAAFRPRRLAWLVLELVVFTGVFLAIAFYAGDRLAGMWWIYPVVLLPLLMVTDALGKRLGFVPRSASERGANR